jgi:hypothetical protein
MDVTLTGDVLLKRVQQVKAAFVSATVAEPDSRGNDHGHTAAHRRELIDAYRESKLDILDSILV